MGVSERFAPPPQTHWYVHDAEPAGRGRAEQGLAVDFQFDATTDGPGSVTSA
jgi:hypothetical protein